MPEGDIVARVARRLNEVTAGQVLTRGELRWPTLGDVDLTGARVTEHASVGKHLLTRLEDGRTLRTHLRMEGYWRIHETPAAPSIRTGRRTPEPAASPDVRCVLATTRFTCVAHRLGMMDLVPTRREHELIGHLGPDLLDPALDVPAAAARILAQGPRPIGEVLLDQRVVCGVGTIYLAETLWRLGIHPWTPAGSLGGRAGDVVATASALLARSVAAPYPTATGHPPPGTGATDAPGAGTGTGTVPGRGGRPAPARGAPEGQPTYVHGHSGRACPRCGDAVVVRLIGPPAQQRPAYFCPTCQPRPRA